MAVDKHIEAGNKEVAAKEYEKAIAHYDDAIKENPQAFKAHYEKSIALQRWGKIKLALSSLKAAEVIALQRGNRTLISQVLFRYATLYLTKDDPVLASKFLNTAQRYSYDENEINLWKLQVKNKANKLGVKYDDSESFGSLTEVSELTRVASQDDETHHVPIDSIPETEQERIEKEKRELELKMLNKDNLYPKVKDIKVDWFQSSSNVTVTLFIKNVPKNTLKVKFEKDSINISFPKSSSSEFSYELGPLYSHIDTEKSSCTVFQTKLELTLVKAQQLKWKSLERLENEEAAIANIQSDASKKIPESILNYPSSSKKNIDWDKLNIDEDADEKEETGGDENAFFKQLYANADDDTKRAMMKSFIESNGTALSTNWDDVSKKTYETTPPDGMEAKKW